MVVGKPPVPWRPTSLDDSRAGACFVCSGCGCGMFEHFLLSTVISLFFFSLSLGDDPIQTEILFRRAIKPKPTNQPRPLALA